MAKNGFVGTYVAPADVRRGPAVMVLGGSEGGDPAFDAMILAARGIPASRLPGPAWLRAGKPVPYTAQFENPTPSDQPDAVIAVEGTTGPVLTVCGNADALWNACACSEAIHGRLKKSKTTYRQLALSYPNAGHAVDFPMPYQPFDPGRPGLSPPTAAP